MTFAGIVRKYKYFLAEHSGWCESTLDKYLSDYNMLLSYLPAEKAMKDYDMADFDDVVFSLPKGYYAESTLNHFRYLMFRAHEAGYLNEEYTEKLYMRATSNNAIDEAVESLCQVIRRSLSPTECRKMLDYIMSLDPELCSGNELGPIIMFLLGTRNNETCGLVFNDFKSISLNSKYKKVIVSKSTVGKTRDLKSGGKTKNSPRVIPINTWIYDFIKRREAYILTCVENGEIQIPDGRTVGMLPVCCEGNDYTKGLNTDRITIAANELFIKLNILSAEDIAGINQDMYISRMAGEKIIEKKPTAYILRRNYATHMYHLGFSETQIKYVMGHDLDDGQEERNFYRAEDEILNMDIKLASDPWFCSNSEPYTYIFTVPSGKSSITLYTREPAPLIKSITTSESVDLKVRIEDHFDFQNGIKEVDVSGRMLELMNSNTNKENNDND